MGTQLGLAWAGVRHRPGSWLLLALGLALAAVMPLAAAGLQERAAVAAVAQAVDAIPDAQRGVLAVTSRDLRGPAYDDLAARVVPGLVAAGLPTPTAALAFRSLALNSTDSTVAALDQLPDAVTLTGGRLPASCTPTACEVLQVGAGSASVDLSEPARALGLVVTGTATLSEDRLVGLGLVAPGQPLLLGSDPRSMAELTALTSFGRNLAWFSPLDGAVVTARGAAAFTDALDRLAASVNLVTGPLNLVWPSAAVQDAASRGQGSGARFAVLGAGAGALQLGFCLVLAAARRPAQRQRGVLLSRRGARPRQVLAVAALQAAFAVVVGTAIGVGVGVAVVAGLTRGVVARPGAAAGAALAAGWPTVLALALGAGVGSVVLAAAPVVAGKVVRGVLVAATVLAAGVAVLALVRPTTDVDAPLPVVALVALTLGAELVGTLLWSPVVSGVRRLGRHPAPLRQVALLTARRPLLPSLTAGFLAAALATAVLAASWASSTQRSAQDRAAATVPLDARVSPSTQVRLPGTVVDAGRLAQAGPGVVVSGLTSTTISAFTGASGAVAMPLVGVDPDVLPLVHRWAAVTGSDRDPAAVGAALRTATMARAAPVVPAGTRELVLDVRGLDADVTLGVWLTSPDGQEREVELTQRGDTAYARLDGGSARTVEALEITESAQHSNGRQHGIGEGRTDRPLPSGTLHLGPVRADGTPLPWSWDGWGSDTVELAREGADGTAALRARYQIRDARAVLVPSWVAASARPPLPVVVDPETAARAGRRGTFGLTLNQATVPVRIVAVLPRMPTLPGRFVLADRAAVTALVDATAPGTAPVAQVWVAAPGASAAAVRPVLASSGATVGWRTDLAAGFADDPVSRGFVALLGFAGCVALLLGLVAVVGGVRGDRDLAAADLFALEVDGIAPGALRRVLLTRAALVLSVGLVVGVLAGGGLAAAAVRLLGNGPDGRPVSPPLHAVLVSGPIVALVLVAILGTVVAAAATALVSLREPVLAAPELDLR